MEGTLQIFVECIHKWTSKVQTVVSFGRISGHRKLEQEALELLGWNLYFTVGTSLLKLGGLWIAPHSNQSSTGACYDRYILSNQPIYQESQSNWTAQLEGTEVLLREPQIPGFKENWAEISPYSISFISGISSGLKRRLLSCISDRSLAQS